MSTCAEISEISPERLRIFNQNFIAFFAFFYVCQAAKFYSIISNFDEVLPYLAPSSSEFLHFIKQSVTKSRDISATV